MRRRSRSGPRPVPRPKVRQTGIGPILHKIGTGLFVTVLAVVAVQANLPRLLAANTAVASETFTGRVTRIVDGDTFWISAKNDRIRVWGLDAPEVNTPGGSAATATLSRLISGQTLTCRQRDIDRYGRIVGQCFLPDGRDITAAMIESGTAQDAGSRVITTELAEARSGERVGGRIVQHHSDHGGFQAGSTLDG